jgi:hypothetical protein
MVTFGLYALPVYLLSSASFEDFVIIQISTRGGFGHKRAWQSGSDVTIRF